MNSRPRAPALSPAVPCGPTQPPLGRCDRLLVGDDISFARNDVSVYVGKDTPLCAHVPFPNDWPGYLALRTHLLALREATGAHQVDFAGEATGWYWFHTFYALAHDAALHARDGDVQLHLFNPRQTHAFKEALGSLEHNDLVDADVIAQRLAWSGAAYAPVLDPIWLGRRILTRHYFHLTHALAQAKTYFTAFLFLKASAYGQLKPFSKLWGVTSRAILSEYSTIQELAELPTLELAGVLRTLSGNRLAQAEDNARRLQEVAARSFPLPQAMVAPVNLALRSTLAQVRHLEQQREALHAAIAEAFAGVPELAVLASIPGAGVRMPACLLAELSPWQRFLEGTKLDRRTKRLHRKSVSDAEAAVAKWAGLWWPRAQSGGFTGEVTRLSKDGNRYARYWFIQLANCLKEHSAEYAAYYERKVAESKLHAHKRALVLTARKAVGLVLGLLHSGQPYRVPEAYREILSPHQVRRQAHSGDSSTGAP
jgi:transposase